MFSKSNWFSMKGSTRLAIAMGLGALCLGASVASASLETVILLAPESQNSGNPDISLVSTGSMSDALVAGQGYTADSGTLDGVVVNGPVLASVPDSSLHSPADGTMDYDYSTLVLSGLANVGTASSSVSGGITTLTQQLGTSAWFKLYSGPTKTDMSSVLLLTATVSSAQLIVEEVGGTSISTVLSVDFTYTGGALYPALQALGYTPNPGAMVIGLSQLSSVPTIGSNGLITPFGAVAQGQLDASTPEPGCMALAAMGLLPLLRR